MSIETPRGRRSIYGEGGCREEETEMERLKKQEDGERCTKQHEDINRNTQRKGDKKNNLTYNKTRKHKK